MLNLNLLRTKAQALLPRLFHIWTCATSALRPFSAALLLSCLLFQCKPTEKPLEEIFNSKEYAAYKEAVLSQKKNRFASNAISTSVASTAKSLDELAKHKSEMIRLREAIQNLKKASNGLKVFNDDHTYNEEYVKKVHTLIDASQLSDMGKASLKKGLFPAPELPSPEAMARFQDLSKKFPAIQEDPTIHQQILNQINKEYETNTLQ